MNPRRAADPAEPLGDPIDVWEVDDEENEPAGFAHVDDDP
jgi:hypothetical protein